MNGNEVNTEEIEQQWELMEGEIQENETDSETQQKKEALKDYPIDKYILQLEKMGAKFLEQQHEKLKISDEDIELNSEMLAVVLEKNFSVDVLKNSPEMLWVGHTLFVGSGLYMIYSELKKQGEL